MKKEDRKGSKKKKETKLDYTTIGIIDISKYTNYNAISRKFFGGC